MRLFELFESTSSKKSVKIPTTKPANFVAKYAKTSGAGSHQSKKYSRKEKHKNKSTDQRD